MINKKTKQDFFTRDMGKIITQKNVGSEVRLSPSGKFKRGMAQKMNTITAQKYHSPIEKKMVKINVK